MAKEPAGFQGVTTFEHIDSETDAAENTVIHVDEGNHEEDMVEEDVSPLFNNSSNTLTSSAKRL